MENNKEIFTKNLLHVANKQAKVYYIIAIGIAYTVGITMLIVNLCNIRPHKNVTAYNEIQNLYYFSNIMLYIAPMLMLTWFIVASNWKWNDYIFLRRSVLLQFRSNPSHTLHNLIIIMLRTFGSIFIYTVLCLLPLLISYLFGRFRFLGYYPEFVGFYIVYCAIIILVSYGFVLIPRMIFFKTNNNKYRFIFWLYFIKSRLIGSPVTLYFGFPIFLLISAALIIIPFTKDKGGEMWQWQFLLNVENLSLFFTVFGLWITSLAFIVNDFLKNYQRIYQCFEEYTTYILREKFISEKNIKTILIGFGNLGRLVCGHFINRFTEEIRDAKQNIKYFEIVIDKRFNLRVLLRELAVIENNRAIFEELRQDENSGLSFGFLNGQDVITGIHEGSEIPSEIAVFGINGDGGYLPVLKLADIDLADVLINTTSDVDMGFRLFRILQTEVTSRDKPVVITTVEDGSTYTYLEGKDNNAFFPVHAGLTEGWSVGSRLFMVYNMIKNQKGNDCNIKIYIFGSGKTVYYIIQSLVRFLQITMNCDEIKKLMMERMIVITDDKPIMNECIENKDSFKSRKIPGTLIWELYFEGTEIYGIPLIKGNYTSLISVVNACKTMGTKNSVNIFVVSSIGINDVIRSAQHLKYAISHLHIKEALILSSISCDILDDYEEIVNSIGSSLDFLSTYKGFPNKVEDLILKKNLIIGNQIISMTDLIYEPDKNIGIRRQHRIKENKQVRKINKVGEICVCLDNKPLAFSKLLAELSGFSNLELTEDCPYIPSFYYSYSYPVKWILPIDNDDFIFRGDAFLSKRNYIKSKKLSIHGFTVHGTEEFEKDSYPLFNMFMKENPKGPGCTYNHRCAVSANKKHHDHINPINIKKMRFGNINDSFATIKLWCNHEKSPGSLALGLADFLMTGKNIQNKRKDSFNKVYDIHYENCKLCHYHYAVNRFYVNIMDLYEKKKQRQNMLSERCIRAVSIKTSKDNDVKWKIYGEHLINYLNSITGNLYVFQEHECGFRIVREDSLEFSEFLTKEL